MALRQLHQVVSPHVFRDFVSIGRHRLTIRPGDQDGDDQEGLITPDSPTTATRGLQEQPLREISEPSRAADVGPVATNEDTPTRRRSTGDLIGSALTRIAKAHEDLAESSLARQERAQVHQLTRADTATKKFMSQFGSALDTEDRVHFCRVLATREEVATVFCGLDDEGRAFLVRESCR